MLRHVKRLHKFVVLTDDDRQSWPELNNVVTIPDMLSFEPKLISPMTEKRILAVGRYCYQKGFDLLLEAWASIQQKTPDWRLDIYGDGDRRPYQQLIDELKIDRSRCSLNSRTSDIEREYANSSMFVLSSRFEGFGLVIVEAMACGLPVVSFDCKFGPGSIIMDEEDGLLVEKGNVKNLSDAMLRLASDNDLRLKLARNAKQSVSRFSKENVAKMWQDLFDSIAQE